MSAAEAAADSLKASSSSLGNKISKLATREAVTSSLAVSKTAVKRHFTLHNGTARWCMS